MINDRKFLLFEGVYQLFEKKNLPNFYNPEDFLIFIFFNKLNILTDRF